MIITVTYTDKIEASSIKEAFQILLEQLRQDVSNEDLTAFTFTDENGEIY